MRLIAIDPGVTAGIATFDTVTRDSFCIQINGHALYTYLNDYIPEYVIIENFKLYPWRALSLSHQRLPAAEVQGIVIAWCTDHGVEFKLQPTSVRKTVPKEWLDNLSLYDKSKNQPHARDAAKHLVYYLAVNMRQTLEELLKGEKTQ